jgi:hypothetical protein
MVDFHVNFRKIATATLCSRYLPLVLLIVQPLIFFRRHLFLKTVHIPYDIQMFHLPLAWFIARCARLHSLPLWNPFSYCGMPIHADIQAQLFYPITWIAILIANWWGGQKLFYWLEWMNPLHMMLGGLFAFILFKKLKCSNWVAFFGGTVYEISPFFVSEAQHLGSICSAAWFPLTILSIVELAQRFTKRWLAILSISIAMSLFAGFPATTLVVLFFCGLLATALVITKEANWRLLLSYASGCVLGACIAGVQLLPTMRLSGLSLASIRWQWKANGGGLPFEALASFFWPNYYHIFTPFDRARYKLPYDFTGLYTHCGFLAVPLLLAAPLFFRKSKMLAISFALFAISIVWMLGDHTPIYPPIFHHLPHFLQGAIYAECANLGFSMLAAIVVTLVLSQISGKLPKVLLAVLIVGNSWNLIKMGANRTFNTADGSWKVATQKWFDGGYAFPEVIEKWTRITNPPLRIDFLEKDDLDLRPRAEIAQLPTSDGDNPFMPLRYYHLRLTYSGDAFWNRTQLLHSLDSPWIRALNVGYVFENLNAPKRAVAAGGGVEVLPFISLHAYKIDDPMPRFYLANHVRAVRNEAEALAIVRQPGFDPAKETIVEGLDPRQQEVGGGVEVHVLSYENNRIELSVNSPAPSFLVTSETFYPGWKATVNGQPAPILPTNVAFRGIPLEAGENRIVMTYFPVLLVVGLIVSVLACAGAMMLLLFERRTIAT